MDNSCFTYFLLFDNDGINGRLFGVTDEVTGTVFSVNDAAGLPIVEVESTSTYDKITIGELDFNEFMFCNSTFKIFILKWYYRKF